MTHKLALMAARPGVDVTIAGRSFGGAAPAGDEARHAEADADAGLQSLSGWFRDADDEESRLETRAVTGRDFLSGSSFALAGGTKDGGLGALWGRGAISGFDGREGGLSVDGEVASATLGADWSLGRTTAGLMFSHSQGEGGYRSPGGNGAVESTLTGLYPYGRLALDEQVLLWSVVGYGGGTLKLTPEGATTIETDMDLAMAALGLRGTMIDGGGDGLTLTAKTDAMVVRTSSDKVQGLAAAQAEVSRLRLGLEGARPLRTGGEAVLTPRFEIGIRRDGGDAETGFGADIGAALAWFDPSLGLEADIRGRGLLTHENGSFRERGFAGSLAWDSNPSSERGLSLTLTQAVGDTATGGSDRLLSRRSLAGLAANDDGDEWRHRRLEARLGYGLAMVGGRFIGTPKIGLGLSETSRNYSAGWHFGLARSDRARLDLGLEAMRFDAVNDNRVDHSLMTRGTVRW